MRRITPSLSGLTLNEATRAWARNCGSGSVKTTRGSGPRPSYCWNAGRMTRPEARSSALARL
jgi:hypothetical protein